MKCSYPFIKTPFGVRQFNYLSKQEKIDATPFPCGQCLNCRIDKSRIWRTRIMLESALHPHNLFLTLTYDPVFEPKDGSISKVEIQLFLKKLRKRLKQPIRYYFVGEYGEKSGRPHYHAMLFNVSPENIPDIRMAWGKGFIYVGDVTMESAEYVTKYILKKRKEGDPKLEGKQPQFATMSKMRGGIGYGWVRRAAKQIYKSGGALVPPKSVRISGKMHPLGRYITRSLGELLELPEEYWEEEFKTYQEELFEKHDINSGNFYDNLMQDNKGKRIAAEKRSQIFKKRSII